MSDKINTYGIVIQARMSSSRLPGKVLKDIGGKPMLQRQVERLINGTSYPVIVATSTNKSDDPIDSLCSRNGIKCFRGSLNNVVSRFLECANDMKFSHIVRVGGDDPLIDPSCCNELIKYHKKNSIDFLYASNSDGWPYGCAAELISKDSLEKIIRMTNNKLYLEHTIPFIFDHKSSFKIKRFEAPAHIKNKNIHLSVDFQEDLDLIREIFNILGRNNENFTLTQISELFTDRPDLKRINEGLHKGFDR